MNMGDMTRRALITGIRGQDGSHRAEHLLAEGYDGWYPGRGKTPPRIPDGPRPNGQAQPTSSDLLDHLSLIAAIEQREPCGCCPLPEAETEKPQGAKGSAG
ncbi:NAD-dependent epimerase/dehydratase family protein [Micromonospora arborensis]|uniref:NAD-dependent epimerase/dehydratase family protein n=1 Tax=Micromonospora arborensis TaxID=2116518 RepID=UPI00344AEC41